MAKVLFLGNLFISMVLLNCFLSFAQNQKAELIIGPMQGHTTDTTTLIWFLVKNTDQFTYQWHENDRLIQKKEVRLNNLAESIEVDGYQTVSLFFSIDRQVNLKIKQKYTLTIFLDDKLFIEKQVVTFMPIKQDTPPNFSFLFGSCTMDIPLRSIVFPKHKWTIFSRIAETQQDATFMLWLGDNVYYRKKHFTSKKGMFLRNVKTRKNKHLSKLLTSMPHYAIWDDHDYGRDNSDKNYAFKDSSWSVFKHFWPNPSYGLPDVKGVFTYFSYQDADFFLLDSRYHKERGKSLLGEGQLDWLKASLKNSTANFKFIVSGSQVISHVHESLKGDAPEEYWALMNFIKEEQISGVLFLSGDRHFGDLQEVHYKGMYPLYDFTSSPLTSISRTFLSNYEKNVDTRIAEWAGEPNFGKVSLEGEGENRMCLLRLYDRKAQLIWSHQILLQELQFEKK